MDQYKKVEKLTVGADDISGKFKGLLVVPTNTSTTSARIGIVNNEGDGVTLDFVNLKTAPSTLVPVAGITIRGTGNDTALSNADVFRLN